MIICHGNDNRVQLQKSNMEKDLGVNVDGELTFSRQIEIQVHKAIRI